VASVNRTKNKCGKVQLNMFLTVRSPLHVNSEVQVRIIRSSNAGPGLRPFCEISRVPRGCINKKYDSPLSSSSILSNQHHETPSKRNPKSIQEPNLICGPTDLHFQSTRDIDVGFSSISTDPSPWDMVVNGFLGAYGPGPHPSCA
jgi:hypothetical protein